MLLIKYNAAKAVEFIQDIMHCFEIPNWIITDLGFPFTAIEFRNWAQDYGISINYALVAHPKANGQVERANGLILAKLKPRLYEELEDYDSKWIEELPKVVWGLRTQVSRATGYSPFSSRFDMDIPRKIEQYEEGKAE
jgi:transposase InsO family protein